MKKLLVVLLQVTPCFIKNSLKRGVNVAQQFSYREISREKFQNFKHWSSKRGGLSLGVPHQGAPLNSKRNYSQSGFPRVTLGIVALVKLRHYVRGGNHQRLPLRIVWTAGVSRQAERTTLNNVITALDHVDSYDF